MKKCSDCSSILSLTEYNKKRSECRACSKIRKAKPSFRWRRCRQDAEKRGILFELSFDDFDECTKQACYLCGSFEKEYNGIDRVNNAEGYALGNVQPCCWTCNNMKANHTMSDFIDHIDRILANQPVKS